VLRFRIVRAGATFFAADRVRARVMPGFLVIFVL
jgi:hypothetical protein